MTESDLVLLPADRAVALLIRHAERPSIPAGELGNELGLTVAGRATAMQLGAKLGSRLRSVATSPVRRCCETAEQLVKGAAVSVDIQDDPLLGAPGVFVADAEIAWPNWERLGVRGVIEHVATSDELLQGMHDPADAAQRLARAFLDRIDHGESHGVHVLVTHDSVLAPFVSRMLGLRSVLWPAWLQGAAVWRDSSRMHLEYEGRVWTGSMDGGAGLGVLVV